MTKEQIKLLIRYINQAANCSVSPFKSHATLDYIDDMMDKRSELEDELIKALLGEE